LAFSSQNLRDLEWAITSPGLIDPKGRDEVADPAWPDERTVDESEFRNFLSQYSSHRVGYYFESLIHFWLQHIRGVEILEQGKQIIEEGITKGEIDFVFRDESGRTVHWEVAVKFYLKTRPISPDGSHLIGPNATDNFAKKNKRLFGRQLELSRRLPQSIELRQGLVKGRIFYHPDDPDPGTEPASLNPQHLRGTWIRASEMNHLDHPDVSYRTLQKPHWLAPETGTDALPFEQFRPVLERHFASSPHPIHLAAFETKDEPGRERERIFVVPDHWPKTG